WIGAAFFAALSAAFLDFTFPRCCAYFMIPLQIARAVSFVVVIARLTDLFSTSSCKRYPPSCFIWNSAVHCFLVIMKMSGKNVGMAADADHTFFLQMFCFSVSHIIQIETHSVPAASPRGFLRYNVKDNHVPCIVCKTVQIHIVMPFVVLRSCLHPHLFNPFSDGFPHSHSPAFFHSVKSG